MAELLLTWRVTKHCKNVIKYSKLMYIVYILYVYNSIYVMYLHIYIHNEYVYVLYINDAFMMCIYTCKNIYI